MKNEWNIETSKHPAVLLANKNRHQLRRNSICSFLFHYRQRLLEKQIIFSATGGIFNMSWVFQLIPPPAEFNNLNCFFYLYFSTLSGGSRKIPPLADSFTKSNFWFVDLKREYRNKHNSTQDRISEKWRESEILKRVNTQQFYWSNIDII